jgi:hypothetical protein
LSIYRIAVLVGSGTALLSTLVWMIAYRVGFSEGRLTVPLRLIRALVEHKIVCLHERPERVSLEVTTLLDVPEEESRRLIDSAVELERETRDKPQSAAAH